MMKSYSDIQKRREQKLEEIRKIHSLRETKRKSLVSADLEDRIKTGITIKLIASLLLLIFVYFSFHAQFPFQKDVQGFITEAMTREFNFKGLYSIYKNKFGGNPAILPTFAIKEKEQQRSSLIFRSPITSLPLGIDTTKLGVYLDTNKSEPVVAIGTGLVVYRGEHEKLGKIITVRHQNGVESTYGLLENIAVEQDEWVESGKSIGTVESKLYLSIRSEEQYINPLDVIAFD